MASKLELQILEAENKIAKAISKLFDLEDVLHKACDKIKSEFGFDFVSISLVFLGKNTIEAVYGIGIAENWANEARHYLEEDRAIQDIQANIVKTHRTEIIAGHDKRFDEGIYNMFNHNEIIRIFTPILLIRDKNGNVLEEWFDRYDWKSNFTQESIEQENNARINMEFPSDIASFKVIGTIEAGYQNKNRQITYEQAVELAKVSAKYALEIREARLRYVLELIAENAKQILQADSVTLHFLLNSELNSYIYQVRSDDRDSPDPEKFSPRLNKQGLGWRAIQEKRPKYINLSQIEDINPIAYEKGTRACAAFPLILDRNKSKIIYQTTSTPIDNGDGVSNGATDRNIGVMYVHFIDDHNFSNDEENKGQFLAEQAVNAIWQAMTYQQVRDKARQLTALHSVTQSINQIPVNSDILKHIAWNILNVLAADVVTIYAYIQTEKQFVTPPSIAGRLKSEKDMDKKIKKGAIPFLAIQRLLDRSEKHIYTSNTLEDELFKNSSFTNREHIKSVASVLLRVDDDIVGVMFINYRRKYIFSVEDEQIIKTLASSAATAIKSQRWLQTLSEIDKKIITTLEPDIIDSIIERAVKITGADSGVVLRLETIDQNFNQQAIYPKSSSKQIENVENIDGTTIRNVIRNRKSELIVNSYKNSTYFVNTISQICVPLLGTDGTKDIFIGVLNVESRQKIFTQRDLQKLEVLADLAVIAIQNVGNNKKISNMQLMSTIGEFTGQLLHQSRGNIGALKQYLKNINEDLTNINNCEKVRERLDTMKIIIERMEKGVGRLKGWKEEEISNQIISQIIHIVKDELQIPSIIILDDQLSQSTYQILAGKQQLIGIISNIIQNALDSMADGGKLSIEGQEIKREGQDYIEIKIKDNGSGISENHIEEIMTLGVTTKSDQGNMGFGLWWTNIQVENLGGKLSITSKIDEGTEVKITMPSGKIK
jgi:GAF domain-containing protein